MTTAPVVSNVGQMMANADNTARIPLIFSTTDLDLRVTRGIINRATPGNPDLCALALAATALRGVVRARFWNSVCYIYYADRVVRYDLDGHTTRGIRRFDANRGMASEPETFTLHAVKPSNYPAVKAISNATHRAARLVPGYTPSRTARGTRVLLDSIGVRNGTGTTRTSV